MTDTIKARTCATYDWLEDADDELRAWSRQREAEYAVEQLDAELGISEPEAGTALMLAAEKDLRSRGVMLADATHDELLAALLRVSS